MCLICVEFQKLTVSEAKCNLTEMCESIGEEHAEEVERMIHDRIHEELKEMLKDFDPFVNPPKKPIDEQPDFDDYWDEVYSPFCSD